MLISGEIISKSMERNSLYNLANFSGRGVGGAKHSLYSET